MTPKERAEEVARVIAEFVIREPISEIPQEARSFELEWIQKQLLAFRDEALEEAAKVCDLASKQYSKQAIAEEIRSLKSPEGKEPKCGK